mgnify:CR=1 FL=1
MNNEFEVLYEFMEKLPDALRPGGRVAILTFHSGEDKLVKKALKAGYKAGIYSDYAKDVIRPSAQECAKEWACKIDEDALGGQGVTLTFLWHHAIVAKNKVNKAFGAVLYRKI